MWRWGRAARAKRGKVEGVPTLGEEVFVVGRRPGAALVKGSVGIVEIGFGAGTGQRDRARVAEALNGTRANGSPS